MSLVEEYNKELYHYGVKGMKWGVRNEYEPVGRNSSSYSAANVKMASKSKLAQSTSSRDHSKSDKSPLVGFGLSVASHILNANLVGVGVDVYRLAKAGSSAVKYNSYKKERADCEIDKNTGLKLQKEKHDIKYDLARVNPLVNNFDNNTKNNCMLCTSAYDLRRRGYEVMAKKASYGYNPNDITAWYPKAKVKSVTGKNTKEMMQSVKDTLVKQGDGARGNIMVTWKNSLSGHSMAYEVNNGKLTIVDAQVNKVYDDPDKILKRCQNSVQYARLDNVEFDKKHIREVAE